MSESMTLGQWIFVQVGSGRVLLVAIIIIVVMEIMNKKSTPKMERK